MAASVSARLQAQLDAAAPQAPDWRGTGVVRLTERTYQLDAPLHIPGGVHLVGEGRVELLAMEAMPAMVYLQADAEGNYYGSYLSRLADFTLNGQDKALVGLQTGMAVSASIERVRCMLCLDAGAVFSQFQNSEVRNCAFEHNGVLGRPLSGGARLADGASTNRFFGNEFGQNWGAQLVICDPKEETADGGQSPADDLPAGVGGPSQNLFVGDMFEDYAGRSKRLICGRAGQRNKFDMIQLSHQRNGQQGEVEMISLTSQDCVPGLETAQWLFRDPSFHGGGEGYTGVCAERVWKCEVRGGSWTGVGRKILSDKNSLLVT